MIGAALLVGAGVSLVTATVAACIPTDKATRAEIPALERQLAAATNIT